MIAISFWSKITSWQNNFIIITFPKSSWPIFPSKHHCTKESLILANQLIKFHCVVALSFTDWLLRREFSEFPDVPLAWDDEPLAPPSYEPEDSPACPTKGTCHTCGLGPGGGRTKGKHIKDIQEEETLIFKTLLWGFWGRLGPLDCLPTYSH